MNKLQSSYQFGRALYAMPELVSLFPLVFAGLSGYLSKYEFIKVDGWGMDDIGAFGLGLIYGISALTFTSFAGVSLFGFYQDRRKFRRNLKQIKKNPKKFPLEYVEKIIIDDVEGLDFILAETSAEREAEWGTLLKAYEDRGRAVLYKVERPEICQNLGLIQKTNVPWELYVDEEKATQEGYNGGHHYHRNNRSRFPTNGIDFAIAKCDRSLQPNWIQLLSFNLPGGPEIIGFNHQFTYLPITADKREFVSATPRQIMEYLSGKAQTPITN